MADLMPSAHVDTFCRRNLPPAALWPDLSSYGWRADYPSRLNLGEVLLEGTIAKHGPERTAIIGDDGLRWSYGELLVYCNRLASALTATSGLVPGNRVQVWGENGPWFAAIWLAVLRAGGVAVPMSPLLTAAEVAVQQEITQAGLLVVSSQLWARYADALPDIPRLVFGADDPSDLLVQAAGHPESYTPVATSADDVAFLVSTSGTTGRPKVTAHFHRDLLTIADTYAAHALRPVPDDVFTGTPHLSFTYGLGGRLVFPLRAGAATVLMAETSTAALRRSVHKHRATICIAAPAAYRGLAAMGEPDLLSSIRTAVSSGEALPVAVWTSFHKATGIGVLEALGTTECTQTFASAEPGREIPGSVGRPLPGFRVAIWDESCNPVAPGTSGRLAVQGPTGCRYLNDSRQEQYVQQGWNVTGDIFSQDADGNLWFHGRADDLINTGGHKVYPVEIENVLSQHTAVLECMVNATLTGGIEFITAHVVLDEEKLPEAVARSELREYLSRRLALYKIPRTFNFVPTLSRTTTGKLRRRT